METEQRTAPVTTPTAPTKFQPWPKIYRWSRETLKGDEKGKEQQ